MSTRAIKPLIRCSMLCVILFVSLAGCSETRPYVPPPPSVQNPPTYPSTQQVQVTPTVLYPDIASKQVWFRTVDTPSSVLAFYQDALLKEGWKLDDSDKPKLFSRHFVFGGGCPIYSLDVIARYGTDETTEVELKPRVYFCL